MEESTLSYEITLHYQKGAINPIDINEHYLQINKIIDANNNIDRGVLRIGALGTSILFTNESNDEIRVQPTTLTIESEDKDRLHFIANVFKKSFSDSFIDKGEYKFDSHLTDENYPDSIFNNYVKTDGLKLDAIRFQYENINLIMFSCGKNKIHIQIISKNIIGKVLNEVNYKNDLAIEKMFFVYNNFKKQDLGIN